MPATTNRCLAILSDVSDPTHIQASFSISVFWIACAGWMNPSRLGPKSWRRSGTIRFLKYMHRLNEAYSFLLRYKAEIGFRWMRCPSHDSGPRNRPRFWAMLKFARLDHITIRSKRILKTECNSSSSIPPLTSERESGKENTASEEEREGTRMPRANPGVYKSVAGAGPTRKAKCVELPSWPDPELQGAILRGFNQNRHVHAGNLA